MRLQVGNTTKIGCRAMLSSSAAYEKTPQKSLRGTERKRRNLRNALIFFHPDCTVGFGITPNLPFVHGSRTIPPVGIFTPPRRQLVVDELEYIITKEFCQPCAQPVVYQLL